MIPVTRPFTRHPAQWRAGHHDRVHREGAGMPAGGTPLISAPLPNSIPGQLPYTGLDPSNPATWVRPYNPQPGMVARLNFNGAAMQGNTDTGGVWSNPASWNALAGARPARRPR